MADVRGSSWKDWKTNPMVRLRSSARSFGASSVMSLPPIRSTPEDGLSRQPSRCMRVDLPDPDGPTTAMYSSGCTRSDTPRSATTSTPSSW